MIKKYYFIFEMYELFHFSVFYYEHYFSKCRDVGISCIRKYVLLYV